jgi:hypothetical protein
MKRSKNERGAVLLVAIIGLIVAGSLVTALVSVTVRDHREGRNTRTMGQAFAAAEDGLSMTIGNWGGGTYAGLAVGDSAVQTGATPSGVGSYTTTVKRLNNELFIVDVLGNDANSGARQRVGAFVKLRLLEMDIQAALTTRGATRLGGSAEIHGMDESPYQWTGCAPDSDLAGIRMPDLDDISFQGNNCRDFACVDGAPVAQEDPSMGDSTFYEYGDTDWDGLVAMATKTVPAGMTGVAFAPNFLAGGQCNTSDIANWGDPLNPSSTCGGYFPIIYAPNGLQVNQGVGQGILLVDGDFRVTGRFDFYGIVIVKGVLETAGGGNTGSHFRGAVMAANAYLEDNTVTGNAVVNYSSCSVQRALQSAGSGAMLRSRGWLYSY